jgi:hypothetical protein
MFLALLFMVISSKFTTFLQKLFIFQSQILHNNNIFEVITSEQALTVNRWTKKKVW